MSAPTDSHLEIAHVLFIDIVAYSKLLIDQRTELVKDLNEKVRNTAEFRAADAAGKLIRIATGDGMALAFFSSPDAPVRCALQLSEAVRQSPRLQLRMGIHSGPVFGEPNVCNPRGRENELCLLQTCFAHIHRSDSASGKAWARTLV